jgi:hypothetical protein
VVSSSDARLQNVSLCRTRDAMRLMVNRRGVGRELAASWWWCWLSEQTKPGWLWLSRLPPAVQKWSQSRARLDT